MEIQKFRKYSPDFPSIYPVQYGILILEKLLLSDLQGDFRLFSANIFIFIYRKEAVHGLLHDCWRRHSIAVHRL